MNKFTHYFKTVAFWTLDSLFDLLEVVHYLLHQKLESIFKVVFFPPIQMARNYSDRIVQ